MKQITIFLTVLISQSDAKQIQEMNQNNLDLTEIKYLKSKAKQSNFTG